MFANGIRCLSSKRIFDHTVAPLINLDDSVVSILQILFCYNQYHILITETYSGPCQICKMKRFIETVKNFNYFHKSLHLRYLARFQIGLCNTHCVENVRISSIIGPHFPAFGLNKVRMRAQMRENTDQKNSDYRNSLCRDK